jgi:hypothetical protein
MTPLFCVPGEDEPAPVAPGRRAGQQAPGRGRRANPRGPAGRTKRDGLPDPPDLLAVTAQRLRRALARSFLRYGVPGDPETAVHAAMNVIEPVLQARDTEILRLRRLMPAKRPGRQPGGLPRHVRCRGACGGHRRCRFSRLAAGP